MLDKIYNYSGVLFTQKDINSLESFCKIINNNFVSSPEILDDGNESGVLIAKFSYQSNKQFFRNAQLAAELEKPYNYTFYYFSFVVEAQYFSVVAVPWIKMGIELFDNMKLSERSLDAMPKYHQVDLGSMIDSLKGHMDEVITVESAIFNIEGQSSNIKTLSISGERPLITTLFKSIDELVEYEPVKVKVVHKMQHSRDFRTTFDNYGNFQFRIGADKSVLQKIKSLFSTLASKNLLEVIDGFYNPMHLKENLINKDDAKLESI